MSEELRADKPIHVRGGGSGFAAGIAPLEVAKPKLQDVPSRPSAARAGFAMMGAGLASSVLGPQVLSNTVAAFQALGARADAVQAQNNHLKNQFEIERVRSANERSIQTAEHNRMNRIDDLNDTIAGLKKNTDDEAALQRLKDAEDALARENLELQFQRKISDLEAKLDDSLYKARELEATNDLTVAQRDEDKRWQSFYGEALRAIQNYRTYGILGDFETYEADPALAANAALSGDGRGIPISGENRGTMVAHTRFPNMATLLERVRASTPYQEDIKQMRTEVLNLGQKLQGDWAAANRLQNQNRPLTR